ncbi:transposase [Streptomyces sp. NPDC002619]|uniref:transposase n=1 Tax=Streptomyces sp. NPDC002619 TaxID=3364655 RepID=UPI0036A8568E
MGSKYSNRYSDEYKWDAIELVRSSGRTVTEVARELGISSESLRGWVKKARATQEAEAGAGLSGPGGNIRDEELKRLRKLTVSKISGKLQFRPTPNAGRWSGPTDGSCSTAARPATTRTVPPGPKP